MPHKPSISSLPRFVWSTLGFLMTVPGIWGNALRGLKVLVLSALKADFWPLATPKRACAAVRTMKRAPVTGSGQREEGRGGEASGRRRGGQEGRGVVVQGRRW